MEQRRFYSQRGIPIIRYPLEIGWESKRRVLPEFARKYTGLDEAMAKCRNRYLDDWIESDVPLFHPGRVVVSHEAMIRLGRMNVLVFLNYHARGGWADGAAAGEASEYDFNNDMVISSCYPLGESADPLWLSVRTSANRSRTVIRLSHERLIVIRRHSGSNPHQDDIQPASVRDAAPKSAEQPNQQPEIDLRLGVDSSVANTRPKIRLGRLAISQQAREKLTNHDILLALFRHERGDLGNCFLCHREMKDSTFRFLRSFESWFETGNGIKFRIQTVRGHSAIYLAGEWFSNAPQEPTNWDSKPSLDDSDIPF